MISFEGAVAGASLPLEEIVEQGYGVASVNYQDLALDVPEIPQEEVLIPEKLASQYDITYGATLTDAYGNQYVLTGRVNKLGFGMGTLTLIVIGILVGTAVVVGVVMTIWNKQKLKTERKYHSKHRKI